jgi:vitamin B12 transporter
MSATRFHSFLRPSPFWRPPLAAAASATLALVVAGALPAAAQVIALDEIVVSPSLTPLAANRTGVSVSVLDRDAIEAPGPVMIGERLARFPGVSFTQNGPAGNAASVRIRGADGRYIAVFQDGVRVDDPSGTTVSFNFGMLPAIGIGRAELLRGSQSALWGGSAVAGVIAFSTPMPEAEGTVQDVRVEAGGYGTYSGTYALTQRRGRADIGFTLSHLRSDGFSAVSSGTEPDGVEATRLSFSTRYRLTDAVTVGASAFGQTTRQAYDAFGADANNVQTRAEGGGRLFAEVAAGRTLHTFEATAYVIGREFNQAGTVNRFDASRLGLAWRANTEVGPALVLLYGADFAEERAYYPNLPGGSATGGTTGGFVQALWAATDRIDVSAAARLDMNSSFGSFATGRLAVAWRPDDATTIRAAIATGYRPPSLDERFGNYPGSFPFVGNPALRPETSLSYELGAERRFAGGAALSATVFRLEIDNLVTYQFGTPATLANVPGTSVRQGLELAGSLPLGQRATLGLAYTYTDAARPNGARLGLVPRHALNATLDARVTERLNAGLAVQIVADRFDEFGSAPAADYSVASANLRYDLGRQTEAWLRVDNLLDARYEVVPGYGTAGRTVHVGLRKRF